MATDVTSEQERAAERRERYGLLLLAIIASFGFQGIASPGDWQQVVITALLATTLVLALWAAQSRTWIMRLAITVGAALVVFSIVEAATGHTGGAGTRLANMLLVLFAPPAIVVGVVRALRTRQKVTIEAVFGVLCLYILLGMFFAFLYGSIDRLGHQFFAQDVDATVSTCLYYSFTTLTTVGYGDLTSVTNLGHTLSVSEALFGQIYLVTVVAVLVSNLSRPQRRAQSDT
jgi:hypothetical protein